jgi:hypothetical protein
MIYWIKKEGGRRRRVEGNEVWKEWIDFGKRGNLETIWKRNKFH